MYLVRTMKFPREVFFVLLLCFNRAHFQSENGRNPDLKNSHKNPSARSLSSNKSPDTKQVLEPETYNITTDLTSTETSIERNLHQNDDNKKISEKTLEEPFIKKRLEQINAQKPLVEKLVSFLQLGNLTLILPKENQTEESDPNSKTESTVGRSVKLGRPNFEGERDENPTNKPVAGINRKQRSSRVQKCDCPLTAYVKDFNEEDSVEGLESFKEEIEEDTLKLHKKRIGGNLQNSPLVVVLNPNSKKQKKRPGRRSHTKKSNQINLIDADDDEPKISLRQVAILINKLIDSYQCCNHEDQGMVNINPTDILGTTKSQRKGKQKRETLPDQAPGDDFFPIKERLTIAKLGAALERILKGPPNDQNTSSTRTSRELNHQKEASEIINDTKPSQADGPKSKWQKRWSNPDKDREVSLSDGDLLRLSINRRVVPDNTDVGKVTPGPDMEIIGQVVSKVIALVSKFVKKFLTTLIQKLYTAGLDGRLTLYTALSILFGLTAGIVFGGAMAVGMGIIEMCKLAPGSNFPTKVFNIVTWPIKYFYGDLAGVVDKMDFVTIFNRLLATLKAIYKKIVP